MARPREFDQKQVIAAAVAQFSSQGYAGTSVQDLCEATGVGKSSLYGAFGDKHDLYVEAFRQYCTGSLDDLRAELEGPEIEAVQRLTGHLQQKAAGAADDPRGCFLASAAAELAEHDPAVAELTRTMIDAYEELIARCIEQAQNCRDVDPSLDSEALTAAVLTALRGIEALGKTGRTHSFMQHAADTAINLLAPPTGTTRVTRAKTA
jgi:TetR/AcrR family transcriptional repressor of nem operon